MRLIQVLFIFSLTKVKSSNVSATWDSIDNRQVPEWYDKAKVGVFVHWGLFSVPGYSDEWFWNELRTQKKEDVVEFMKKNYKLNTTYEEFAPQLTGEFFNATEWAELFKAAGAKYVVFTSKHHDGFTMYPSKYTYSFNSVQMGPKRDVVKEVGDAVKAAGMRYGI